MGNDTRICTKCNVEKPLTEYHRDKRSPDGLRRQCKPCRCNQTMDWWYENQERQLARHRDYVDANRDRVREIDRERYYRSRESRLDQALSVTHARRARRVGADFDYAVTRAALRERDGDNCHYCAQPMEFDREGRAYTRDMATVEHVIPISAGGSHTFDNTVLACWGCNSEKRSSDAESFRERVERRQDAGARGSA